jgi:hypothetical protein
MAASTVQNQLLRNHLSSVVISVLLNIGLLALLLTFITVSGPQQETDKAIKVIETTDPEDIQEIEELIPPEEVNQQEMNDDMTLDMSEMITEQMDTSVPEEQTAIASPVVSPVIMQGLAQALDGVNLEDLGDGTKRATRFMGQSASGNRFAFVIDYSKSMSPLQLQVMKHELTSALAAIGEQGLATVLFFSGPVWRPDQDAKAAADRWQGDNWTTNWRLKEGEEGPKPQWLVPDRRNMAALQRMIYQTPTTGGTDWYPPMKEVLEMQPRPDIIFFMTDGATSKESTDKAIDLVKKFRRDVQVNTVALGVKEKDAAALEELAEMTGGKFRPYTNEELKEIADDLPDTPKDFSDTSLKYLSLAEVRSRQSRQRGLKRPPPEEKDVVSFEID